MNIPSKIVEQAVEEFSSLPSIGKRSALRFVLHLLKQDPGDIEDLSKGIYMVKVISSEGFSQLKFIKE